jgi:hypothetical protein
MDLSFERTYKVLKLAFTGDFTEQDLDAIDPAILRFMAGPGRHVDGVRCLYDMTAVTALAVPTARFSERAQVPPLLPFGRIVVPYAGAPEHFGRSYRAMRGVTAHDQPLTMPSLEIAYGYLGIQNAPQFEPLD